jgi:carboxylesterase type B
VIYYQVPKGWKDAGKKAGHGLELSNVFGDLSGLAARRGIQARLLQTPALIKMMNLLLMTIMMRLWAQFAATSNSSFEGLIKWFAFKPIPCKDKYVEIELKPEVKIRFYGMEKFK